jgi:hypothetical protein
VRTTDRRSALVAGVIAASMLAVSGIGVAAQDAETAKVRVLHASPDAPKVDVYANGAEILSGVGYGVISNYLEVPAGEYQIQVVAEDADPAAGAVIDATLTFAPGTMTTVAATNALESIEAQVFTDTPAPTPRGVQVRVIHLSADTPAVDIAPDGGEEIIQGLAYPTATDYLSLPAGQLDVELRPAGAVDGWVALNPGGVMLYDGNAYTLFAIGSLDEGNVRLLSAIDATADIPDTAMVRVLHGSPDAPAVDVYADGTAVLTGVEFGAISDYLEVPAGEHQIQVVAAGADPADGAVIDATINLIGGTKTTVAATNVLAEIEAQVIADDPAPVADQAQIRVVHLSADAPAVDIAPDGKKAIVRGLEYPTATDYLTVDPGRYDLEVRPAGKKAVALDLDPIQLKKGNSYSAFAIGSLEGETLTVVPAVDATVE